MLHLGHGDRIDPAVVDRCVSLVETTSPSGLLTGLARRGAPAGRGPRRRAARRDAGGDRRAPARRSSQIPGLAVLDESMVGRPGIAGWDPLRLSVDVRGTGSTGYRLAKKIFYSHGIDLELYSENVVVAIFGLGEPAAATGERLVAALRAAVGELEAEPGPPQEKLAPPPPWGELVMTPREAYLGPQEVIPFEAAAGRIAAEGLAAYPPGIPNVLPGERLTAETLAYIRESDRPRRLRPRRLRPRAEDAAGRPRAGTRLGSRDGLLRRDHGPAADDRGVRLRGARDHARRVRTADHGGQAARRRRGGDRRRRHLRRRRPHRPAEPRAARRARPLRHLRRVLEAARRDRPLPGRRAGARRRLARLPPLGLRVGGARPGAAPGGHQPRRGARPRAAAAELRQLDAAGRLRPEREVLDRAGRWTGSPSTRRCASSSTPSTTGTTS